MNDPITIVLATSNERKRAELRALITGLPIELVGMSDLLGDEYRPPEDGATFEDNAAQKALAVCKETGLACIGDDSGLEVKALGGRPGVRSARFANDRATDAENNARLLQELEEVEERDARFRCVLALATPWLGDEPLTAEGRCDGFIARTPRGGGGFGYDPLFVVSELGDRSMAELSERERNGVSDRARAARELMPKLAQRVDAWLEATERIIG